jgi:hypothetical protein
MKMEYSQTIINKRKVKQMCLHFVIWKGKMSLSGAGKLKVSKRVNKNI